MNLEGRVRVVRRIGTIAVVMTILLMVLGSWVKATGSGLSCPDWPHCYGQWLPPFPSVENGGTWTHEENGTTVTEPVYYTQAQVLYEWTHRAVASLLGIPILLFAILAVTGKGLARELRILPAVAIVVLGIQFGIGGATVLQGNPAAVTTLHLATATLFLVILTIAVCVAYLRPLAPAPPAPPEQPKSPPRFSGYTYTDSDAAGR